MENERTDAVAGGLLWPTTTNNVQPDQPGTTQMVTRTAEEAMSEIWHILGIEAIEIDNYKAIVEAVDRTQRIVESVDDEARRMFYLSLR